MIFDIITEQILRDEEKENRLPVVIKEVRELLERFQHIFYEWTAQYDLDRKTLKLIVSEKGGLSVANRLHYARLYTWYLFDALIPDLDGFVRSILWDHIYQLCDRRLIKKEAHEGKI